MSVLNRTLVRKPLQGMERPRQLLLNCGMYSNARLPIGCWFVNHGKEDNETGKGPRPAIAEQWNVFQRSASNRSLVRKPRQGDQRNRGGHAPAIAELRNAFQRSTLSQFLISRQFICLGKDGKPKSGKHGVIGLRAINRTRVRK